MSKTLTAHEAAVTAKHRTQPLSKTRPARKRGPAIQKATSGHDLMVIPRDHIIPFRANVFGLARRDEPDSHVSVFDPDGRPDTGDKVVILWADKSRRPEFGYYSAMEGHFDGSLSGKRRVQLLKHGTLGSSPREVRWFQLGAADLLAREIGTFTPHDASGPRKEGWPSTYKKLCSGHGLARTKEQWDSAQIFAIDNPVDSPWPGWETLTVDPDAPLGPNSWVAAIEPGATPKMRRHYLGKVAALKRSFEIEDVTTGKQIKLGSKCQPHYGVVIGMHQSIDVHKRSNRPKSKPARGVALVAKRRASARRIPSPIAHSV